MRGVNTYSRIYLRFRNHMQKYFNPLISDPRDFFMKKTDGWKSRETVPLICILLFCPSDTASQKNIYYTMGRTGIVLILTWQTAA
jgi:hypothetical protein